MENYMGNLWKLHVKDKGKEMRNNEQEFIPEII